jgi:hypothetical protein
MLDLSQFYGTENYYRIAQNAVLTDGAKYVSDELGAYWLFLDTALMMLGYEKQDHFAVIRLSKKGEGFIVELGDGNDRWKELFSGEFTDFPNDMLPFEFFAGFQPEVGWVFMLKSEY